VVGSTGRYVWFGLTSASIAACAAFYRSGSATDGKQLWSLSASSNQSTPMVGPFLAASGVYVALTGLGASAIVAMDADI
jgi:hypothetical protein